jgi:hypothetical protein
VSEGRLHDTLGQDSDWLALSHTAQWLYVALLWQPERTHAGTLTIALRRWARLSPTLNVEMVRDALLELAAARFVVVDFDTDEILIRTYIRNDGVYRQPNVFKSAARSAAAIASPLLREAVRTELLRLPLDELAGPTRKRVEVVLEELLERFGPPPPSPGGGANEAAEQSPEPALRVVEGFESFPEGVRTACGKPPPGNPSGNPSGNPNGVPFREPFGEPFREPFTSAALSEEPEHSPGPLPAVSSSAGLAGEPFREPFGEPFAEGSGRARAYPHSPSPSPSPLPTSARSPSPGDLETGGDDLHRKITAGRAARAAAGRPLAGWEPLRITQAIADAQRADCPPQIAWLALAELAADPETVKPSRLASRWQFTSSARHPTTRGGPDRDRLYREAEREADREMRSDPQCPAYRYADLISAARIPVYEVEDEYPAARALADAGLVPKALLDALDAAPPGSPAAHVRRRRVVLAARATNPKITRQTAADG